NLHNSSTAIRKENCSVVGPTRAVGSLTALYGTYNNSRTARDRNLLEVLPGKESDPLTVGRKERSHAAFRSGNRNSLGLIEFTLVELKRRAFFIAAKHQHLSIRTDSHGCSMRSNR